MEKDQHKKDQRKEDEAQGLKKEIEGAKWAEKHIVNDGSPRVYHAVDDESKLGGYDWQIVSRLLQVCYGIDLVIGKWEDDGVFIAEETVDTKYRYKSRDIPDFFVELHECDDEISMTPNPISKKCSFHRRPLYNLGYNRSTILLFYLKDLEEPFPVPIPEFINAINGGEFDDYLFDDKYEDTNRWKDGKKVKLAIPWGILIARLVDYLEKLRQKEWEEHERFFEEELSSGRRILPADEIEFVLRKAPKRRMVTAFIKGKKIKVSIPLTEEENEIVIIEEATQEDKAEFTEGYIEHLHDHSIDEKEIPRKKKE